MMERSKIFAQLWMVASLGLLAGALFLFVWWTLKMPAFQGFPAHTGVPYRIGFVIGWYARFYGMATLLAVAGWLMLRWSLKKFKVSADS